MTTVGCVVLTQGDRPAELRRAVASVLRQRGVRVEIAVVGNGWQPAGLEAGVRAVHLPVNVGATAGRNAGVPHVGGELLLFLDDDAELPEPDALARLARSFADEPRLGLLQPRVADAQGRPPPRHWVPRLRVGDRTRSGELTAVWEGALVARRSAFEAVGGWPERFVYFHEGIDLAWRMLDAGWLVRYRGDVVVHHPALPAARHAIYRHVSSRNRVWLARRHLPLPFAIAYVLTWFARTAAGQRSLADLRSVARGYLAGLREPCGERRPLRWATLWRMTRAGRPPLL